MRLSPNIFKAHDIRGVVPLTVNEEMAQALGAASARSRGARAKARSPLGATAG